MLLRKILRDLSQRKLRTFLTIAGLAIAVFCITGFGIVSDSILKSAEYEYGAHSADTYIGLEENVWNGSLIANQPNITDCEVTYFYYSTIVVDSKLHNLCLRGIESYRLKNSTSLAGVILVEGELPVIGNDEILFDVSCAKALELNIGDELNFTVINSLDIAELHQLKIVGLARSLYESSYTFDTDIQIWMDITQMQDLMDKPGISKGIYLTYKEGTDIVNETRMITKHFKDNNLEWYFWETYTLENDWRYWLLEIINLLLILISVVGLIIGGVLTANTIQMAIASERKDIALTKIVGGSKKDIFRTYILEALFFGILGTLVGMILSIVGAIFLLKWMMIPFNISTYVLTVKPVPLILGIVIPIAISVIFALVPIRSAVKVPPIEALRDKEAKFNTSRRKIRLKLISLRYSLNNLLRKKARLIMNIIMISLAIGLVVSTTFSRLSYLQAIDDYYNNQPLDISASIQTTELTEVTSIMENFTLSHNSSKISDTHCMRWEAVKFRIDPYNATAFVRTIGILETDSILEHYNLVEGRYFNSTDSNSTDLIIPSFLVRIFNEQGFPVIIGSKIELQTQTVNQTFTLVGIIDDLSNGGFQFYIPMLAMNNLYNCSTRVNVVYIELEDASLHQEIAAELSLFEPINARGWLIQSAQSEKNQLIQQMNFTLAIFAIIVIMGLVIAIFGGLNSFTMSAMERQKEIALLKLIGSKPRWIISSFLTEGLLVGFLASVIGTFAVGIPMGVLMVNILSENLMVCNFVLSWSYVLIGFLVGGILGVLSSLYPAYKASKTNVVSALSYE